MATELERLRAEVARRQKAASAKVARLRRKGVELSGTQYDPRKESAKVGRMNRNSLNSYLGQLNTFLKPSNSFVPDSSGAPLRRVDWVNYKRLERMYNRKGQADFDAVADIFVPSSPMQENLNTKSGQTIRQRRAAIVKAAESNAPFSFVERDSTKINGEDSLKTLSRDMIRRNSPSYLPGEIAKQRAAVDKMLVDIGNPELTKTVKSLTDQQFHVLINHLDYHKEIVPMYVMAQMRAAGKKDDLAAAIDENENANAVNEVVEWVQGAVPNSDSAPTKKQKPNSPKRKK